MSIILILSFTFSGCGDKQPAVVDTLVCPKIETLKAVPKITIAVDANGSIVSQANTDNLLRGATQLRKSEEYYFFQVSRYNSKYTKKGVDK